MEGTEEKKNGREEKLENKNGFSLTNLIQEHLTILDLSNRNIQNIENVKLPINLIEINLSKNKLSEVPVSVLNLENLKVLDLSHNQIKYFDDTPKFCHSIVSFDISSNYLHGPPNWIWLETPMNLTEINLSNNANITKAFHSGYFEKLLKYKTQVTNIIIFNCKLAEHMDLLSTFPKAKSLVLGTLDYSLYSVNNLEEVPCNGIDKCCNTEYLNLSNTNIYYIKSKIQMYKKLKEINLSHNKLDSLPEEFCLLENLETCIISYNCLYTLPKSFCNLSKLKNLSAECNDLYSLPDSICKLPNIQRLDVYDNCLNEAPEGHEHLVEVDLAQNYFEEPNDENYMAKRKLIRANEEYRYDGRKEEDVSTDSEQSNICTDDEISSSSKKEKVSDIEVRCSSPEDWDSDDYWVPYKSHDIVSVPTPSPWVCFVKKKIAEGSFCPIDLHVVPVAEQVRYEKMCSPRIHYESDGQFDDYSGDES